MELFRIDRGDGTFLLVNMGLVRVVTVDRATASATLVFDAAHSLLLSIAEWQLLAGVSTANDERRGRE